MRFLRSTICAVVIAGVPLIAAAADIYVDNLKGNDTWNGTAAQSGQADAGPFKSIARSLKAAGAGDTVHLAVTGQPYRETASFYGNPGGTPGKPLVFDGQGAFLTGADLCPATGWTVYQADVYTRNDIPARMLIVNGDLRLTEVACQLLKPGEVCYVPQLSNRLFFALPTGTKPDACRMEVGQPDGSTVQLETAKWQPAGINGVLRYNDLKPPTWVKLNGQAIPLVKARDRLQPGQWCSEDNAVYYRPPTGKTPDQLAIECSVREHGMMFGGTTAQVIVRNVNITHVFDDGYNLHGRVSGIELHNCNAYDCGDQGFSAHDDCSSLIDGAEYRNCKDGVYNVTRSRTTARNLIICRARAMGYAGAAETTDTLENVILIDNANQLQLGNGSAKNVLIVRTSASAHAQTPAISCSGKVTLSQISAVGNTSLFRTDAGASVRVEDCFFAPAQGVFHIRADNPEQILSLKNVRAGADAKLEWGSKYPFKSLPPQPN